MKLNSKIAGLIGALLFVVLAVAVAPTMFANTSSIEGAPTFVTIVLPLMIGAGVILAVWKAFN